MYVCICKNSKMVHQNMPIPKYFILIDKPKQIPKQYS